jgi:hypothetical protein
MLGDLPVKEVSPDSFAHVCPKLTPRVGLREDVERETLSAVAAVRLLRDLEDQFSHAFIFALPAHPAGSKFDHALKFRPGKGSGRTGKSTQVHSPLRPARRYSVLTRVRLDKLLKRAL